MQYLKKNFNKVLFNHKPCSAFPCNDIIARHLFVDNWQPSLASPTAVNCFVNLNVLKTRPVSRTAHDGLFVWVCWRAMVSSLLWSFSCFSCCLHSTGTFTSPDSPVSQMKDVYIYKDKCKSMVTHSPIVRNKELWQMQNGGYFWNTHHVLSKSAQTILGYARPFYTKGWCHFSLLNFSFLSTGWAPSPLVEKVLTISRPTKIVLHALWCHRRAI